MKPSTPYPPTGTARKAPPSARPSSSGGLLALFLFVIAVIAAGFAWWEHGRVADAEARVAALEAQLAELRSTPERTITPPAVAAVVPEPMQADEPPAPPNDRAARQRAALGAIGNLLNNPQIQQLAAGVTQNLVSGAYAGFVQQMNMGEEQAAAFNGLVAQRALIGQEVLRSASAQGLDLQAGGAQLQQQVRQAEAQVDQQIHSLLGDAGFQQYQAYTRTVQQQFGGGRNGLGGGF
jgi:hypothetical protein